MSVEEETFPGCSAAEERHWHAYLYTGRSCSEGMVRRGEAPVTYPSIAVADWLRKPRNLVAETFHEIEPAMSWLAAELSQHPPLDEHSFPLEDRLRYSREHLEKTAGNDVVHGYYSTGQQYVSRVLIACPREEFASCPYGVV